MADVASEKRPPGSLAERFWSLARTAPPAPAGGSEVDPRDIIRYVLEILDQLAQGQVGDGVSQATVSFLALLRQSEDAGDLSYASPEQARGDAIDERSLVFSVGVLIFEELTGRHPFGSVASPRRVARLQKCELGSGVQYFPKVPSQLRTVLMKAMGPFPEERYQSLVELRSHLERYAKGVPEEAPKPAKRVVLRGLPPSPADIFFPPEEDEDEATTILARAPEPPRAPRPAPKRRRSSRVRDVAERLGWVALGAACALAVTLIALPRLKSGTVVRTSPSVAPPVAVVPTPPAPAPVVAQVMEPPQVPPIAAAPRFDPELAAKNALERVRTCFAALDHTVSFGAGLLYGPASAEARKAYLAPDELAPGERRCIAKALVGVSAGAAPSATNVPELRFRLRPDPSDDEVRVK